MAKQTVPEVIKAIRGTSSTNGKKAVLSEHRDNQLLRDVLYYTYHGEITFGVKKIPDARQSLTFSSAVGANVASLKDALKYLPSLADRKFTGNAAIDLVRNILSNLPEDDAEVFRGILDRNLRCGLAAKSINSVFGEGFVREYQILLAGKLDKKTEKNINFPAFIQQKMDGIRVNLHVDPEARTVRYFTRKGKELFFNNPDKDDDILDCVDPSIARPFVLDGEALAMDDIYDTPLPRKTSNGILNKAGSGTISYQESCSVVFYLWDFVYKTEFDKRESTAPYDQRLASLDDVCDESILRKLPTRTVNSVEEARKLAREEIDAGNEGIILKDRGSKWSDRRATDILKIKDIKEAEFEVIGAEYGQPGTKFEKLMGKLHCRSADGKIEFRVGSGFTEKDRETPLDWWTGRIITVEYNEVIQDKTREGIYSLYLPIYIEVRHDKDEADTYDTVTKTKSK